MIGTTVRAKFPVKRRNTIAAGNIVVERLKPAQQTKPQVSRAARMLALAHYIERLIEAGELRDYAEAARALGLTRARLTQVMNLLLLAPEVQERVLVGEKPMPARSLRKLTTQPDWSAQP